MLVAYKGTGSIALSAILNEETKLVEAMFMSITGSEGKAEGGRGTKPDLKNAITFSFNYFGLAELKLWFMEALKGGESLKDYMTSRDYEGDVKSLFIKKGTTLGTFGFTASKKGGDGGKSVFATRGELYGMSLFVDKVMDKLTDREFVPWTSTRNQDKSA